MRKLFFSGFILVCIIFTVFSEAYSNQHEFYKELNVMGGYSHRDRWVAQQGKVVKSSVGFEDYRKFSNDYGDFLTTDLQMRVAYNTALSFHDGWGVEIHNAWMEYKLGLGQNIRAGHFAPAFGLEPVVDTHGTLLQTLMGHSLGFKKDWGAALRGIFGPFDYQIAGQFGSGMGIGWRDGNYLFSGRLSTPASENFQAGLSLLYGEVLQSKQARTIPQPTFMKHAVLKKRIGLDGQYLYGPLDFKMEGVFGQTDGDPSAGFMFQTGYTVPKFQEFSFKLQTRFWNNDLDESDRRNFDTSFCTQYILNSTTTIRLAYFHDFDNSSTQKDRRVILQVYLYGF